MDYQPKGTPSGLRSVSRDAQKFARIIDKKSSAEIVGLIELCDESTGKDRRRWLEEIIEKGEGKIKDLASQVLLILLRNEELKRAAAEDPHRRHVVDYKGDDLKFQ